MSYEVVLIGDSGGEMLWDIFASKREAQIEASRVLSQQYCIVQNCSAVVRLAESAEQNAA